MDLLFSRYASPFIFIDSIISCGRFAEFVREFYQITNEEKEWQFYLHKIFDRTFEDFKTKIQTTKIDVDFETTIQDSVSILNTFIPE